MAETLEYFLSDLSYGSDEIVVRPVGGDLIGRPSDTSRVREGITIEIRSSIRKNSFVTNTDIPSLAGSTNTILPKWSRYRKTKVYPGLDGAFGKWRFGSNSFNDDGTDTFRQVVSGEEFRLDLISFSEYGTPDLWWAIALANDIRNPFVKPYIGEFLRIPNINRIQRIIEST